MPTAELSPIECERNQRIPFVATEATAGGGSVAYGRFLRFAVKTLAVIVLVLIPWNTAD